MIILRSEKQCYQEVFELLLSSEIPDELLEKYLEDKSENCIDLQDFIINNMRKTISWSTAIGIIEAADRMVECAQENANVQF